MRRIQVNNSIQQYWLQCKKSLVFSRTQGKKIPSFTRHNGSRLNRLKDSGWRYPRSSQGNGPSMKKPSIGYRNAQGVRHTIRAYGLIPEPVRNTTQLETTWANGRLPVIAHQVGGRKRGLMLEHAKARGIPLLFRR